MGRWHLSNGNLMTIWCGFKEKCLIVCSLKLTFSCMCTHKMAFLPGNRNKGKGNDTGLTWESQSHCFADKFSITHAHSFGTDTQHDYSKGNF